MNPSKVELAVLNNTFWYESMFAAHGLTSETDHRVWRSHEAPPPFHSNLVVLAPATTRVELEVYAADIESHRRHTGWSLKDSYATLDLESVGCSMLFQADWIWRDPGLAGEFNGKSRLFWTKIADPIALAEWEHVWSGDGKNDGELLRVRQFPARMLESPDHAFFAGRMNGKVLAGGIANSSPGVVGLSNVFSPSEFLEDTWNALALSISRAFPATPIVGYERGHDLNAAQRVGFTSIGKLRVWTWPT